MIGNGHFRAPRPTDGYNPGCITVSYRLANGRPGDQSETSRYSSDCALEADATYN